MSTLKPAEREGKVYQNPIHTRQLTKPMWKMMWEFYTIKTEREPAVAPGPFVTDTTMYNTAPANGLRVTWIGHSSLLIEIDGKRILTDPVWADRASFAQWIGPKRFFQPPFPLSQLPPLDLILLSHDHYDHLDKAAIKQLAGIDTPIVCSFGVGGIIEQWGINRSRITELNWTEQAKPTNNLSITATPARHFSGRGIVNRNQTLWSSFVINGGRHNIFFGADSGWFPGFKDIGDAYGPFDLTMLEVGAYGDGWPDIHMGPEHASNAHLALNGKIMMPIHWGTFNLALHPWKEPVERIQQLAAEKNITLFLPEPGKPTEVAAHNSGWWAY